MSHAGKQFVLRMHRLVSGQLGIDPIRFLQAVPGLIRYMRDFTIFRRLYRGELRVAPYLHDWHDQSGATKSEYFWQDLLVAQWIYDRKPAKHVDVGSRIDGFVAHLASFREVEVFDVRPLTAQIPRVSFRQADVTSDTFLAAAGIRDGYCDSLSCLHALEHFGLGRYGDPIDPMGHKNGIENMAKILKIGGLLYLSVPIGQERVEFNANRVFNPQSIIRCAAANYLILDKLTVIDQVGNATLTVPLTEEKLQELANATYNLGIFTFKKASL